MSELIAICFCFFFISKAFVESSMQPSSKDNKGRHVAKATHEASACGSTQSSMPESLICQLVNRFETAASKILEGKQCSSAVEKASSTESLTSPAEAEHLPVQAASGTGTAPGDAKGRKSLEEFEMENLEKLKQRDEGKKGKPKSCKGPRKGPMKRPASNTADPNAKKTKNKPAEPKQAKSDLKGCLRCRGNKNGCASCLSPGFCGLKLTRAEWVQHAKLHKLK